MDAQIVVVDFGGQYAHLIARRIRQLGVFSQIILPDTKASELSGVKGIILSGGPQNLSDSTALQCDPSLFDLGVPVLGLCYGQQLMVHMLGGTVESGGTKEYGVATLKITNSSGILSGMNSSEKVWMSHGDMVTKIPDGFEVSGTTSDCPFASIEHPQRKLFGMQFHPEVTHTPHGMMVFRNFIEICACETDWSMKGFIDSKIAEIKEQVGDNNVFLLVSGGVDSSVAFALLNKALGSDRVYGLHIDNGCMRKNESQMVKHALKEAGFSNFHVVDATDDFLTPLVEVYEPEQKRKIIGETFVNLANTSIEKLHLDPSKWMLGQGTIYPDTIESAGTKHSSTIKTHHNRVESIQKLIDEGKIVEPLAELYKDEVREVGRELGLSDQLIERHPFPGPGLGVRVLCLDGEDVVPKEVDEKINAICSKYGLVGYTLPIKSVGVQGDSRTYKHPAALVGDADWKTLGEVSTIITNSIPEINRVVWLVPSEEIDCSSLSVKPGYLTKKRLTLLKEADSIVESMLTSHNLHSTVWQFPVVLVPLGRGGESIVLRPVHSTEAMTAEFGKLPKEIICEYAKKICSIEGIDSVFYDVTNKPPGTIEWE